MTRTAPLPDRLASDRSKRDPGREVRALTGLRGVAALWVVLLHLSLFLGALHLDLPPSGRAFAGAGFLAVDAFFVLSGFVLAMTSLGRVASAVRDELAPFLLARICRIAPLHLVILAAFVVFAVATGNAGTAQYRWGDLLLTACLLQLWGPGPLSGWNTPAWSIAAEMVAYVAFPLLASIAVRLPRARDGLIGVGLAIAGMGAIFLAGGSDTLEHVQRLGAVRCLGEFSAGVMLWRAVELRNGRGQIGDILLLVGIALFGLPLIAPTLQFVVPVACCALVAGCYLPGGLAPALFGNRWVHWLGAISFSIYLDHFLVFLVADRAAQAVGIPGAPLAMRVGWIAGQLAVVVVIAMLTWRYVEQPSQALGRRLRRRLEMHRPARARGAGLAVAHSPRQVPEP